jgi:hypothetical protein
MVGARPSWICVLALEVLSQTRAVGQNSQGRCRVQGEEEKVIRLEGSKAFEVFAKGEIRLEIGNGKLLAERISKE